MTTTNFMLIDDHTLFRNGLRLIIESEIETASVCEFSTLEEVLSIQRDRPDAILLDVKLQGLNGLESISLLRLRWPNVPIVMISSDASSSTVKQAYEKGANHFVSKAQSSTTIIEILRSINSIHPTKKTTREANSENTTKVTPRQLEVLNYLNQGLSNKAIARKIFVSENTVRGHVQSLLAFLNATSRTEAVFNARKLGFLD